MVFDSHEDFPKDIYSKGYIPQWARPTVSLVYELVEKVPAAKLDAMVAATPAIAQRLSDFHSQVVVVRNFPLLEEVQNGPLDRSSTLVVYVGGIGVGRGARSMVSAMAHVGPETRLGFVGTYQSDALRRELLLLDGWSKVVEFGWLDRSALLDVYRRARAGLVLLMPEPNFVESLPIKMFEYMAAGLPVIASGFPAWQPLVEGKGILVDPQDPLAIAKAIDSLVSDSHLASTLGEKGRQAIRHSFNWESEAKHLLRLYDQLA